MSQAHLALDNGTTYPALYRDDFGEERTVIKNDGDKLRMTLRGVEFIADDPDSFSPVGTPPAELLLRLPLYFGDLCSYTLSFDISVHVVSDESVFDGTLHLRYDMGGPSGDGSVNRGLEREDITASLMYEGQVFATSKSYSFLEEAMAEIERLMPAIASMKICLSCAFGLESDFGCGGFAGLGCFRDEKEEVRQAKHIFDVCRLWDRKTQFVQGIHVCSQFEKRTTPRP